MFQRILVCLLLTPTAAVAQTWGRPAYNNGYRPVSQPASQVTAKPVITPPAIVQPPPKLKNEQVPPPAPRDPEDEVRAVKTDTDIAPRKGPTKEQIIKQIENNPHLGIAVKREILAGLRGDPPPVDDIPSFEMITSTAVPAVPRPTTFVSPIPIRSRTSSIGSFDMLEALRRGNLAPGVKSDTDTAKPASPPRAADPPTGDKYEIPETDVGITVGAKVDPQRIFRPG
jgi:hypothetical protein